MIRSNTLLKTASSRRSNLVIAVLGLALLGTGCASTKKEAADVSGPQTFASPDLAAQAFVAALRASDKPAALRILGPDSEDVLFSGDTVADQTKKREFLEAYDEKHRLVTESDGRVTLVVGNKEWPLPVPIVADDVEGPWYFDVDWGREEILNRRIGQNELTVIEVCREVVSAQKEYASVDRNGDGVAEYAQSFGSDKGKKNGLYWETAEGEPLSPLGPLVADAVEVGYSTPSTPGTTGETRPFHGYCYRILTSQGASAEGGAMDYIVNGKMIGGFAVVAYPADYGNSGVVTFITNHLGIVYERDLGDDTTNLAKAITTFDPTSDWKRSTPASTTAPATQP